MHEPLIVHSLAQMPLVQGALAGLLTAAHVDYQAFKGWSDFHDAYTYDWRRAIFRWVQGAVGGAVLAAGLGSVL